MIRCKVLGQTTTIVLEGKAYPHVVCDGIYSTLITHFALWDVSREKGEHTQMGHTDRLTHIRGLPQQHKKIILAERGASLVVGFCISHTVGCVRFAIQSLQR